MIKRKLLLFLSQADQPGTSATAATFAWLAYSKNHFFDNYYDSYHQGVHFPGGDSRNLDIGQLTGGTVLGDRHWEEFNFLLLNFDVSIISLGETFFLSTIKNLNIPIIACSNTISSLYKTTFSYCNIPLPSNIVMIGSHYENTLRGLDAYIYPEIYYREAIGVLNSITDEELSALYQSGSKIYCCYVDDNTISRLTQYGYTVEIIDQIRESDNFLSITTRIARRWESKAKGWILGDPTLVSHWIPKACEENLISIYSIPQEKILSELGNLISSKGTVVYGRQYSDQDFFTLSKLNQSLQVIDPCRPPFQSVKHVNYTWKYYKNSEGFYNPEYSDEELKQFAQAGKVLVSLFFWSGMIREVANFYNLLDLFAMTKLKCGLVLTAQSYEYMMHLPLELLTVPLEQGGVYPYVEPVLGSTGIGVAIESYLTKERLEDNLRNAVERILQKVESKNYVPRGLWLTMDTELEKLSWWKRPKPIRLLRYPPYLQMRYHKKEREYTAHPDPLKVTTVNSLKNNFIEALKEWLISNELDKYFLPYRPYEFYKAGSSNRGIIDAAKSAGMKYMFTKAGFNKQPRVQYMDKDFLALNYTAGQWDGWTPFETINDVTDLRKSENNLLKRNKPGWIVSTIDSCLWTFSGEFWKRGGTLYDIALFCARGGSSRKLINVKPSTIARYARIIAEQNLY